ncbi:ABC transporter ATP-binding protein [Euhalothece natronophila Z-M001]|uniref:ABC transporter ATP-binding protein n=1 Tax=Euhalothece natronophila Z-M001 TaxID=522448 RepID=A0A5B8NPL3_9CHRO|nr:ABC transporter ATP-binding protein [Euhalothece natronophila]QDZ40906.1 ABC transporter ATP-binding protein [Euhalothece natronophila Z-M001]
MDSVTPKPNVTATDQEQTRVVQTWDLKKVYRTGFWLNQKVESLKGCTITVYEGETFGLLGPNGAGKTTLLKILLGIVRASSGRAVLLGKPISDRAIKQRIGYLPENPYLYDYLTAWEFLQYTAGLFNISRAEQKKRIPQLIDTVGIDRKTAKKKQLRQYSKGMLQRIGMAQALINNPEVVFLDEPMSGLDPIGRYQIRQIILALKEQGKTIFFNSHVLGDVEQICDRVAILAQGEIICTGSLDELLGSKDTYQVAGKGGNSEELEKWISHLDFADSYWHGQLITGGNLDKFLSAIAQMDAEILELKLARASLEEFFLQQLRLNEKHKSGDSN